MIQTLQSLLEVLDLLVEEAVLTRETHKKIVRIALERMEQEHSKDFEILSHFRTELVRTFLAWIKEIRRPQQLEAALSVTCSALQLRHIECTKISNCDYWANSYRMFPINLDRTWRARRHVRRITALVHDSLGPLGLSQRSPNIDESNPLYLPQIRTALELNTNVADIVVLQFWRNDKSLLDLSYVSLLGLGPTGWRAYNDQECISAVGELPSIIAKIKELVM